MIKRLMAIVFILIIVGCSTGEETNEVEEGEGESALFRLIDIVVEDDQVEITGDVKSWDGNFYYHILDGEEIIKQEEKVSSNEIMSWSSFVIELDKADVEEAEDVPHIVLYSKNKNDKQINSNYVPIDLSD